VAKAARGKAGNIWTVAQDREEAQSADTENQQDILLQAYAERPSRFCRFRLVVRRKASTEYTTSRWKLPVQSVRRGPEQRGVALGESLHSLGLNDLSTDPWARLEQDRQGF
jgi:hypothetical protein